MKADTTAMLAYGKEVVALGEQMDVKFALLQGDVHSLINELTAQLHSLKRQFIDAKDAYDAAKRWNIFWAAFDVVKAAVCVGACFTSSTATAGAALLACGKQNKDVMKGAMNGVKDCLHTFKTGCQPCKALKVQMKQAQDAEQEINELADMTKAAEALNDQLSKGVPLPKELPLLISDKIAMESLRTAGDALKQEIVKEVGSQGQKWISDINDWIDMGVSRVSLFLSYYNMATRAQNDQSSLAALQNRTALVKDQLQKEHAEEAAVIIAARLIEERQHLQADLVLKYIYDEWKQLHFYSLAPLSSLTGLPDLPSSTDLLKKQKSIEDAYQAEIERQAQAGKSAGWIYIEVNASAEPHTIAELITNGSTNVMLPIPLKSTTDPATGVSSLVADTRYNNVRLFDVGVYPLDANGHVIGGDRSVEVIVTKGGASWFFDSDMRLHTFSHQPIKYTVQVVTFRTRSTRRLVRRALSIPARASTQCAPTTLASRPMASGMSRNVEIPDGQGIDLSKLQAIRFEVRHSERERPALPKSCSAMHALHTLSATVHFTR